MKILVVYASRESGNTKKLAEAIAIRFGEDCRLFPAADAPAPDDYDFIALGFGVYRGWPDGDMRAYMKLCRGKNVGLFMTLGAWPDSDHAVTCLGRAEGLLESCHVVTRFACQGAYTPEFLNKLKSLPPESSHGWTSERAERVAEAMKHPDENDLKEAAERFFQAAEKCGNPKPSGHKTGTGKKALVAAFFGTTVPEAARAYDRIEEQLRKKYPDLPVFRAYNSQVVREKLNDSVQSLSGVLKHLATEEFDSVDLLAGFLSSGEEYHKMRTTIAAFGSMLKISISRPPLSSLPSLREFLKNALCVIPAERKPGESVIFMGHGHNDGRSDFAYMTLASELKKIDPDFHLACVEGNPVPEEAFANLRPGKVWLIPFMLTAGDHALNDMAGEAPDAWKKRLEAAGHNCACILHGLGESTEVAGYFASLPFSRPGAHES